jgi:hypothetical protein
MKAKKYNYGGKMEEEGAEIEIKAMDLPSAAAVKASGKMPTHYKVKACYYSED